MKEHTEWLLNWFKQRNSVPGNTPAERLQVNYFEAGLIDSFGIIQLIADVEEHFNIRFNERHFQERRFSTIGGLSDLIAELLSHTSANGWKGE